MYSPQEVLANIDKSLWTVIAIGTVTFGAAYLMYIEASRLGFRQKTHAMPVFVNMYNFAHDIAFVMLFKRWFFEVDHILFKLFWGALVFYGLMEAVVHYQTLRYSGERLFPGFKPWQRVSAYVLAQVGVGLLFWLVNSLMVDKLFLLHFTITVIIGNTFNIPMLLSRNSAKGQSLVFAASVLVMTVGFFFFLPVVSSSFATPLFQMLGVGLTILGIVYLVWLARYSSQGRLASSEPGAFRGQLAASA